MFFSKRPKGFIATGIRLEYEYIDFLGLQIPADFHKYMSGIITFLMARSERPRWAEIKVLYSEWIVKNIPNDLD